MIDSTPDIVHPIFSRGKSESARLTTNNLSLSRAAIMTTFSKLPTLVRDAFVAAQKTGDLSFYQTQVAILKCNGLPVSSSSRASTCADVDYRHSSRSDSPQLLRTNPNPINPAIGRRRLPIHSLTHPRAYSSRTSPPTTSS
jgi:hypothetical protein